MLKIFVSTDFAILDVELSCCGSHKGKTSKRYKANKHIMLIGFKSLCSYPNIILHIMLCLSVDQKTL